MKKLFLFVILLCLSALFLLVAVMSLPGWYDSSQAQQQQNAITRLSKQIQQIGPVSYLAKKLPDLVKNGSIRFNETEFNALLHANLASDAKGRQLLRQTEDIRARFKQNRLEIGAVVNIDKVDNIDPEIIRTLDKVSEYIPGSIGQRLYLAIEGTPRAINGGLGFSNDVSVQIGKIPIPNALLNELGVSLDKIQSRQLRIKKLRIKQVEIEPEGLTISADQRFN